MIKVIPNVVDYIQDLIMRGATVLRGEKIATVKAIPGKVGTVVYNSLDNHSSKVGTDVFGNPEKDIYYYIRSNHLSSKPIALQRDLKKSPE